jgi:uncharacterized protein (TIGR02145 family)
MASNVDSVSVEAGTRNITVTDSEGCQVTDTITIVNTTSNLAFTNIAVTSTNCWHVNNGSITFSATGTEPLYYSFADIDQEIEIEEQPVIITDLHAGTYQISLYDANGCKVMKDNITIVRERDFVQAVHDEATTYVNQSVSGNVVTNDFDYYNGPLTVIWENGLKNGTFTGGTIPPNGYYTYQPNTDFVGQDTVYYMVENDCGLRSIAALIITVLPIPPDPDDVLPPIALDNDYVIEINNILHGNVLDNDENPNNDGSTISVTENTQPMFGTVVVDANGNFTYTPNTDYVGADEFEYVICLNTPTGYCDTATVRIRVVNRDDLTIIAANDNYSVPMYDTLRVTIPGILINDIYPEDLDEPLEVTLLEDQNVQYGTLTFNNDGTFEYIPNNGFMGTDGFGYEICATKNDTTVCDQAYVTITVYYQPCPDMPVFALDGTVICQGDSVELITLLQAGALHVDTLIFYIDNGYSIEFTSEYAKVGGIYYARAFNEFGCHTDSDVTIDISPTSSGGAITPSDTTICSGNDATLTLSGNNGTILWQKSTTDATTGFADIGSETAATLNTGNLTVTTWYRAVVTSGVCPGDTSLVARVTVNTPSVSGTITPSDTTVCSGNNAILKLSGNTGTITWEKSTTDATSNFAVIGGETAATLNTGALTINTWYRAVVTSGVCPAATSVAAKVTVNIPSDGGSISATETQICYGHKPEEFELSGKTGNVLKWQYSDDNFASDIHDILITSTILTDEQMGPSFTQDRYFRAVVQNGVCPIAFSDTLRIIVDPLSVGGTTHDAQFICYGDTPEGLHVEGKVGNVIHWEYSDDNFSLDFNIISSTDTAITSAQMGSPLYANRWYRAAVQSGKCDPAYSTHLLVTVYPPSSGGTISSNQSICLGSTPNNLTLSDHTGDVLKWQYSDDNFVSNIMDIDNSESTTLTSADMGILNANRWFRAVVQSGVCPETVSDTVLITILPVSVGGIIAPTDTAICEGNNALLRLTGYVGAIQWQRSTKSATTDFENIPNQTSSILNTGNVTVTTWYRAVVTSNSCKSAVSNVVRVGFIPIPAITLISIQGTDEQTVRQPHAITDIVYKLSGEVDITVTGLPDGVSWSVSENILTISGIPLEIGTFNYTITVSNICGSGTTASGYIIVKEPCPETITDDVNNITYNVVDLVGFCWYKENMYGTKYQDETDIPFAQPYYSSLYPNTAQNAITFGLLYTYEDLTSGVLCPEGWRLPTSEEWALLNIYKVADLRNPLYWLQPNNNTNLTRFDARGAGRYNAALQRFEDLYGYTAWWSSDSFENNALMGIGAMMNYYCNHIEIVEIMKGDAISIRCLRE